MSIDDLQRSVDNSEEAALTKSQEVPEEKVLETSQDPGSLEQSNQTPSNEGALENNPSLSSIISATAGDRDSIVVASAVATGSTKTPSSG